MLEHLRPYSLNRLLEQPEDQTNILTHQDQNTQSYEKVLCD